MQTQSIQLSYSSLNKRKSHKGLFVGIAIIVVLVLLLVTMIALLVVDNKRKDTHSYGVIFSVGENATTAHAYRWNKKHKNIDTLDFHEIEYLSDPTKNFTRTVSSCVSALNDTNYDDVYAYFEPLMDFANSFVPSGARGSTPVYVRLLEESNVDKSKRALLVENIERVISDFGFKVTPRCVECVSKEEEHACMWLAMNYLRGVVYKDDEGTNPCGNYGIFCMTNYSNTAIFKPKAGERLAKYNHNITLSKAEYTIYDYSCPEYGKEPAFERVMNLAISRGLRSSSSSSSNSDELEFPCYMRNYNTTYGDDNITVRGTGNASQCIDLITEILNKDAKCEIGDSCAINGVYMPNISSGYESFFALDEFYNIANFLGVSTGLPTKLESLRKNTEIYCNFSFSVYEGVTRFSKERLARYCFDGAYSYSVLHAYRVEKDTVIFANNVEGVSFDYPYGAMLTEIDV